MHVVGYYWTLLESMHDRCMRTDRHVWIVTMLKVKMKSRQVPHASNTFHLLNHSPIFYMELMAPQWTKQDDPEHVVWSLCQHMPYLSKLICMWGMDAPQKSAPASPGKATDEGAVDTGGVGEASSFEPFDAFQLGLIHAWLLFLYMHANGITAVFQSRRGGYKVPWFAHQCCLLDFPPYSFSSSPGQLQESLWTWLSTQIQVQDIASVSQLNQICRSSQALSITGHELAYACMMRKQKFRVNKDQDFWGSKSSRKKNCARLRKIALGLRKIAPELRFRVFQTICMWGPHDQDPDHDEQGSWLGSWLVPSSCMLIHICMNMIRNWPICMDMHGRCMHHAWSIPLARVHAHFFSHAPPSPSHDPRATNALYSLIKFPSATTASRNSTANLVIHSFQESEILVAELVQRYMKILYKSASGHGSPNFICSKPWWSLCPWMEAALLLQRSF